jgi:protein SCO1/2
MAFYKLRNLGLLALSIGCLTLSAYIVYLMIFEPERGVIQVGGPFSLTGHDGRVITDESFGGRYMMIYFGYTYCPDVCATKLAEMTIALDLFAEQAPTRAEGIVPIFISVDPERDTPAVLGDYRQHFHPRLVAATGPLPALRELAKSYKVYFQKVEPEDDGTGDDLSYLMDHSTNVYLMGKDGRYLTHFTLSTPVDTMVQDFDRLVR